VFELNLPNVLTLLRILLVPVLVAALVQEGGGGDALAAAIFALASFTDALDGWIARRQKSVSTFGKLMDPLADKLLVTAALVSLVDLNRLSSWVAMVIIAREFAVTGLRQLAMEHGEVIPASIWGKLKTVAQVAMVLALILVEDSPTWLDGLIWLTVAITIASGADYFFGFRSLIQARQARRAPS
jgi:CDP-diacylglycerol--glycerol-3-phosphate 3-phosphatidyltransferase